MLPYPSEQTQWPAYEEEVRRLYEKAKNEGKRGSADPDWAAMRWFSRAGHSSAHMGWHAATQHHLNELAAELGVSR